MKALILAGGKGSELLPMTANTPKPIVPVGNIPFIFYQLDRLKKAGIKEVILSLSYQPRHIQELLGDGSNFGLVIHYTVEAVPQGTAGALRTAAPLITGPTLVMNGDILTGVDLSRVIEHHRERRALVTLVEGRSTRPERLGVILKNRTGRVTGFIEKPRDHELQDDWVNMGVYVMEREILDAIPAGTYYTLERELFPGLIGQGAKIIAQKTDEYWCHIDNPCCYLQANFDVLSGRVPLPKFFGLFEPRPFSLPASSRMDAKSFVHESCVIKENVVIENAVIGEKCRIEEGVQIRDSVIMSGSRLKSGAYLRYSMVGRNCVLGEAVTIGKGAFLGDKTTVADFSRI